jgi:hypothetical protein
MQRGCRSPWRVECAARGELGGNARRLPSAPSTPSRGRAGGCRARCLDSGGPGGPGGRAAGRVQGGLWSCDGERVGREQRAVSHHLNLGFNGCRGRCASAFSIETRQMTGRGQSHVGGCSKPCLLAGRGWRAQPLDRRRVSRAAAGKECKANMRACAGQRAGEGWSAWAVRALTLALRGLVEGREGR